MKILQVVIAKVWGGGEQYVYDTSKALALQGIEVHIAVDKSCPELQRRFAEVGQVVSFNLHSLAGLTSLFGLQRYVEEEQIDIINCHSGHAMALCVALRAITHAKLVCFKHNALPAKLDAYHKWQREHTDAFVCVSQLVYALQTQGLKEAEKAKFHLVYNGIDTTKYDKAPKIAKDGKIFTMGYAGRLAKDKGLDVLLKALQVLVQEMPSVQLLLAGSDEKGYKAQLAELITRYNLTKQVKFLGQVTDMPSFYRQLDVFVLPSVVREAFGLTLCEAMYCEVPVITTDSGAQREIINSDTVGTIVSAGDSKALAEAITWYRDNPEKAQAIAMAAEKHVQEHFTIASCAQSLGELYANLD